MYIKVRVIAGAKKETIIRERHDHFEIFVKEKPERNMANTRIREIIAAQFNVPVAAVRIINGHQSPHKLLSVYGID